MENAEKTIDSGHYRRSVWALVSIGTITNIGDTIATIAMPWFILQTSGSASRAGLVAACSLAPLLFSSAIGGALVDRVGPKWVSWLSDVFSALSVAMIPLFYTLDNLPFELLLFLVFLGAIFDGPGSVARQTLLPHLVERSGLSISRINGLNSSINGVLTLVGPFFAAALITTVGTMQALWFTCIGFTVSAIGVMILIPSVQKSTTLRSKSSLLSEMRDGVRFLVMNPVLRLIAGVSIAANFLIAPLFSVILPVYVRKTYGDISSLSFLISGLGAGILSGSLLFGLVASRYPRRLLFTSCGSLIAIGIAGLVFSPPMWASMLLLAHVGLGAGFINPLSTTVFQLETPDAFRGRVFGTIGSVGMLASPISVLAAGAAIEFAGPALFFVVISLGFVGITVLLGTSSALSTLVIERRE